MRAFAVAFACAHFANVTKPADEGCPWNTTARVRERVQRRLGWGGEGGQKLGSQLPIEQGGGDFFPRTLRIIRPQGNTPQLSDDDQMSKVVAQEGMIEIRHMKKASNCSPFILTAYDLQG